MLRRAAGAVITLWLAATLVFVLLRLLPGDALLTQLTLSGATEETIAQRRAEQGLTDPVLVQYGRYLAGLVRGDLGLSLLSGQPVGDMILQQLTPTVLLAASALALAVPSGVVLGCAAALPLRWGIPSIARLTLALSLGLPIFWTGTLAIHIFSGWLNWLPSGGGGRLSQLVLPALVLGFHTAGAIGRSLQASVRRSLAEAYVATARSKGLTEVAVILRHVLRVGLLPAVTVVALQAGFLLGGAVITESLFVRPGLGRLLLELTLRQDYAVVQGIALLAALVYVLLNLLADGLYRLLDPRVAAE